MGSMPLKEETRRERERETDRKTETALHHVRTQLSTNHEESPQQMLTVILQAP
jgi:hypothetical protein